MSLPYVCQFCLMLKWKGYVPLISPECKSPWILVYTLMTWMLMHVKSESGLNLGSDNLPRAIWMSKPVVLEYSLR